jgi:uncharacterized GH25 family protein
MRFTSITAAAALLLGAAGRAAAHDFWIEPATHVPRAGETLEIRLRVGDHFAGEEFPRSGLHCDRFELLGPGARLVVEGRERALPAGRVTPMAAGLHWIVYRSRESTTRVEPAAFARYLEEEGLAGHVAAWKALDPEARIPMREAFSRCAKTLVNVGAAAGGRDAKAAGFDRVAGLKLEIVPEVNPLSLAPGDALPVLVRWDGQPVADLQVAALSASDPAHPVKARTDAGGRARLTLARPGTWLVKAVRLERANPEEGLHFRSTWATLTFDLPAPVPVPAPALPVPPAEPAAATS